MELVPHTEINKEIEKGKPSKVPIYILALLVLLYAIYFVSKSVDESKVTTEVNQPKISVSEIESIQKEQQVEVADFIRNQGYPEDLPKELIIFPEAKAKATKIQDKNGKEITSVEFNSNKSANIILDIYLTVLNSNGWLVNENAKTASIEAHKDNVNVNIGFKYSKSAVSTVVITYDI